MSGHEALAHLVMQQCAANKGRKITLLATGPLNNVAHCVGKYGAAFTDCVERLVVMGGAVHVDGNVLQENIGSEADCGRKVDGSAEWNFFWCARSAQHVLCESVFARDNKTVLFAMDATNHVPITEDRVREFGKCRSRSFKYAKNALDQDDDDDDDGSLAPITAPFGVVAGCCWAIVPWYPRETAPKYHAFDVLTAAYLVDPTICDVVPTRIGIVAERNHPSEGRSFPVADGQNAGDGQPVGTVLLATNANQTRFYEIMYDSCSM